MEGSYGQGGDPWKTPDDRRRAALNGTGKHTVPQRPSTMPRIETPPVEPRVARPRRDTAPKRSRRTLLILGGGLIVCLLVGCALSYTVANYLQGLNAVSGAANSANDFLSALSGPHPDYTKAYGELGPNITLQLSQTAFQQQAQASDHCFGTITNYTEVQDSAVVQGNTQSYTYTITRSKPGSKPYQLKLSLQQDPNTGNSWKISDYGSSLGPAQPTCA